MNNKCCGYERIDAQGVGGGAIFKYCNVCGSTLNEEEIMDKLNKMCEQSLSPDMFEKWKDVVEWLLKTRSKESA